MVPFLPCYVGAMLDSLSFCKGSLSNVHWLLDIFSAYAQVSCQVLSPAKSNIFPSSISKDYSFHI
jgi:hypothetical protein